MNKKHMTLDDRYTISQMLAEKQSFKQIASTINKSCTSVSREIRNPLEFRKTDAYAHPFNACIHCRHCSLALLCEQCDSNVLAVLSVTNVILSVLIFRKKNVLNWTSHLTFATAVLPKETAL